MKSMISFEEWYVYIMSARVMLCTVQVDLIIHRFSYFDTQTIQT